MYKQIKQGLYAIPEKQWIAHHGIKGQQWGVRNGPPYPLDSYRGSSGSIHKKKEKIGSENDDKKSWAFKHNPTPQLEQLEKSSWGDYSSKVSVPKKWGKIDVEYPKTNIEFDKNATQETIDNAYKDLNSFIDEFNKNPKILDDIKNEIFEEMGHRVWNDEDGLPSKKEFKDNIDSINSLGFWVDSDTGNVSASMYFNDGDMFWGHVFDVEYDLKKRRVEYISLAG